MTTDPLDAASLSEVQISIASLAVESLVTECQEELAAGLSKQQEISTTVDALRMLESRPEPGISAEDTQTYVLTMLAVAVHRLAALEGIRTENGLDELHRQVLASVLGAESTSPAALIDAARSLVETRTEATIQAEMASDRVALAEVAVGEYERVVADLKKLRAEVTQAADDFRDRSAQTVLAVTRLVWLTAEARLRAALDSIEFGKTPA